jgi:Ser/Thr protein kinase RdoA (MazF antagonist)
MGEIYRLDTDTGVYAVKRLLWEVPEESAAQREVAFAQLCGTVGVPSPRVLRTAEGAILLPAGSADTAWRVAEWVEGSRPARLDPAAATWLAGVAARIHGLADPAPGVLTDPGYLRVDHGWDAIADRATAAGVDWAPQLRSRLTDLWEATRWVNSQPEGQSVRCHRDLMADNLLRTGGQGWVLLDWDNVGPRRSGGRAARSRQRGGGS